MNNVWGTHEFMKHDVETAAGPTCPPPPYIPRQPLRDRETIEVVQRRWWLDRCLVGRTIWNSNSRIFKKARPEQRDPISGRLLPAPPTDISFTRIKFRTTLERVREIFEDVGGDGWLFQGVDVEGKFYCWWIVRGKAGDNGFVGGRELTIVSTLKEWKSKYYIRART